MTTLPAAWEAKVSMVGGHIQGGLSQLLPVSRRVRVAANVAVFRGPLI